jgi:hypothetical protein
MREYELSLFAIHRSFAEIFQEPRPGPTQELVRSEIRVVFFRAGSLFRVGNRIRAHVVVLFAVLALGAFANGLTDLGEFLF